MPPGNVDRGGDMTAELPPGAIGIRRGKTHFASASENYVRELVAFYDIAKKISSEKADTIDDWLEANNYLR
jgi:hypothetical protein